MAISIPPRESAPRNSTAPDASAIIHTDFKKGFICAETTSYEDYIKYGGSKGAKENGKTRQEGKEYLVKDGDIVNIPSITDLDQISITLTGQFKYPGTYSVRNGEKLSHLLERAGGFTESSYVYGTVFTRKSVAAMENASFQKTADDMETAIASALIAGRLASGDITAVSAFIQNLRETRSPGRLVVDLFLIPI